ncbi:MAG: hypothetical protein LBO64_08705 [Desulfovibrio sp.]|nr:hypothetical protein [Desulfovibrio sp.]
MNPISEKNLWQYLHLILEIYPEVRREWLYFGEGEMLAGSAERVVAAMPTAAARLQAEDGGRKSTAQKERIAALEGQLALLKDLVASKDEIITGLKENIALQKRMMQQQMLPLTGNADASPPISGRDAAMDIPARGARTATDRQYAKKDTP